MSTSGVEGLAEAHSLFGAMPQAAREQLGVELAIISRDVLAAQRGDVAKDTRALEGGLTLALELDQLRVRVGLINTRAGRSKLYYGRFVERGRRAQTVIVTRHLRRKVKGNGKTSKRRMEYAGKPYSMRVRAMSARPFVYKERPEIDVAQRLANFWGATKTRAGAGA